MDIIDAARNINKTHEEDILNKLYTKWGEALDPEHVLAEYPRPQFKRDNYTILNGYWNYAFTTSKDIPAAYDGRILVPFSPESLLSGVERQLHPHEYLWYERTIVCDVPDTFRLILHFGAVDQHAAVYLNGESVCEHHGGYLPFEADITPFLRQGDNSLLVRVQDFSDTSHHSRGKQTLKRGGMFYTAQSGIWQTVWMECVPEHHICKLKITPDYDKGEVSLLLSASGREPLNIRILSNGYCIFDTSYEASSLSSSGKNTFSGNHTPSDDYQIAIRAKLSEIHPWSPDSPFLYTLCIGYGQDVVESYFAMRIFTTQPDEKGIMRFCLNHKPLFLHGVLDQGYWSDGLYTAPSDEALIYDIRTMQRLGFNMMRKHIKIEAARWYYHCDRLGMIVWQDMVSGGSHYSMPIVCYLPTLFPGLFQKLSDDNYKLFGRHSEEGRDEWLQECTDTVDYLYNVPSIAVWVPFNEGWGQFDSGAATKLIKEKDPSRPVDQTSGWFDQGGGDFKSVHNYFRRLKVPKDPRAFVVSEYGGYACHIDGHSSVERIYGYKKFSGQETLTKAYHKLIDEELKPLIDKGLCGAVYTQVSDVEEEVNGLLTYDRKVCKLLP
ncbi:glycosyl hydrolase family 2 [Kineothrix alysoides]|uniref:Glycosyl hydrolase family 2 n=1 Tax=Kineothrix alysoides TaxID=1469948 RepID=A0A4R1R1Q6_9FIRM|nr:sugar-binding domain-containing protein [Kineothrix alysoides]TCL59269.1 glycosyl hydrolase family 2 [Kineothrix alysoides]